jgi:ABC-type sugar transport system permease subunit
MMEEKKSRQLSWLLSANAVLLIGFGIAFALYGPLMMAFFGVPELLEADAQAYWELTSFARMFGGALFGFGLLVWSVRSVLLHVSLEASRGILFALLLAHLMGVFISITQQSSIWGTPAGWLTTGIYILLTAAYAYFLVTLRSD